MPQCAVATCRNSHRKTKGRRVRYHRFPAEESVRERWVAVCGRSTIFNTTTARVCSLHFSAPSYERDVEHELLGLPPRSRLRRGAVPDLFVPIEVPSLIKKFNSSPPAPRNYARHAVPHVNGGVMKNFMLKGGKLAKQGQGCGNNNRRRGGAARVMLSGMTPPVPPSPLQQEANDFEVLLALGLVPRNNNSLWGDVADGQSLR
ncbi:hypothetical protein B566_EDAN010353 [Ephemera danica]|nr:hypothetical protein B566_EDAN010353 [Ephemera danica]